MSVSSQLPCESLASELYHIYHAAEIPHRKHIRFNKRPRRFYSGRSILCNGKAEFSDCEFLCNVSQTDPYITVSSFGEVHFNRCTFKKGFNSGLFLTGNSGCRISFTDCHFIGCNNFAQMNDCAEVIFNGCQFQDCTSAVVQASFLPESYFEFENNIWRVATSPKAQSSAAFILSGENKLFHFKNCRFIQWTVMEDSYSAISAPSHSICLLNCNFERITFTISALAVMDCTFSCCKNVLATNSTASMPYPSLIEGCRFFHCCECIQASADTEILHSTFTACMGTLIRSASKLGHVHIADCAFLDCVVNAHGSACIELDRDCSIITGKINKMENCTFENCRAEKGNLIGYQNEITPGYVAVITTCRFNGCSDGEDGNLIRQKVHTRNFYGKAQSCQIYTFYRERAKFILTNCWVDSDTVLDNTPKTQYDTYDKAKCTARRGLLKEKIASESAWTSRKVSRRTFCVHSA